jgi:8-oxo-dGTP diphosphatase
VSVREIVSRVILEKDGKILLLERSKAKGGGYGLVGGHVEDGETPMEALIREVKEEINIDLHMRDLHLFRVVFREKNKNHKVHLIFKAERWKGKIKNKEPHHHPSMDWFSPKKFPSDLSPVTEVVLKQKKTLYLEVAD